MFGYQAFYALKCALVEFFYAEGDLLPTNQPDGIDHVYKLLDLYRNEVDTTLLNLGTKKKNLYFIELENQLSKFESPFDELYIPIYSIPQAQEISQKIPLDTNGNRSGQEVLAAICQHLFSDGIYLERQWTGGIMQYPNPGDSTAFFTGLNAWQKLCMRYKHVHNITLGITEHIATKRNVWGMHQNPLELAPSAEATLKEPLLVWTGDAKKLAELLYLAEKAGMLNLKELRDAEKLEEAMNRFCEGISFTKPRITTPGKALYNCLLKIKHSKLGEGNLDHPSKMDPWGRAFTRQDKMLNNKPLQ